MSDEEIGKYALRLLADLRREARAVRNGFKLPEEMRASRGWTEAADFAAGGDDVDRRAVRALLDELSDLKPARSTDGCIRKFDQPGTCAAGTARCVVDHEMLVLGRRLMRTPGYAPAPLMAGYHDGGLVVVVAVTGGSVYTFDDHVIPGDEFVPDLREPASRGVLLGQLRDRLGDRHARLVFRDGEWWLVTGQRVLALEVLDPDGEGEALVVAVEKSAKAGAW